MSFPLDEYSSPLAPVPAAPVMPPVLPSSGRPPRPYSRVLAIIAWTVIILSLALTVVAQWRASHSPDRASAAQSIEFETQSRFAVGQHQALTSLSPEKACPRDPVLNQVKESAKTPTQQAGNVAVIAELEGPEAARSELDRLTPIIKDPNARADLEAFRRIYTPGAPPLTTSQQTELLEHQGWLGELALSSGREQSDPARKHVLAQATHAFVGMAAFSLLIVAAGITGLALMVLAIVRLATHRVHLSYRPDREQRSTAYLEAFAIYIAAIILMSLLAQKVATDSLPLYFTIVFGWVPLVLIWPLFRGTSWQQLKGAWGWYTGQGLLREAGSGIIGYLAGLPLIGAAAAVSIALAKITGVSGAHPIVFSDTKGTGHLWLLFGIVCVQAPVVEETMFRGALLNHLRQWHGWLLSALITSAIFAALHPQGFVGFPVLAAIAFVFAAIREWRGSFIASTTAHALNNTVVMIVMLVVLH